jgi:hypothetical protein
MESVIVVFNEDTHSNHSSFQTFPKEITVSAVKKFHGICRAPEELG